jgi:phosphoadenosine phosphosulfate reductase
MINRETDIVLLQEEIVKNVSALTAEAAIVYLANNFAGKVVFSTSFGIEDQVVTAMIAAQKASIDIFTLDTGRMFAETYSTWSHTIEKYGVKITACYPEENALQEFITTHGPNSFYEAVELRKQCCFLRKVVPLKKALANYSIWITGIRAAQSNNRDDMPIVEWDEVNRIIKFHPLLYWSFEEVTAYVKKYEVPYNPLHDKGFVSIGCAPCTRAIKEGEDFRAGRWWWEDNSKKECGLHIHTTEEKSN